MTTMRKAIWLACMIAAEGALLGQDSGTVTLHVYVNTIQVPVLVLGPKLDRVEPISTNRFSVSFDSGPWFPVTHTRLEGDDPISLVILLDVSGHSAELMGKVSDGIAGLAPTWLRPRDNVSIYSLDCNLMRSAELPAEAPILNRVVDNALTPWRSRMSGEHAGRCKQTIHLWDALVYATNQLRELPGRRVILVLTDGDDKGSRNSWNELKVFAQTSAVAVFAVRTSAASRHVSLIYSMTMEDPLSSLCQLSGGMVFTTDERSLAKTLRRFTSILRERYIVEFPRAHNGTAGFHDMEVRVSKGADYFIRPTGISVPIADPALARDPTTVPTDPAHEPEMGTRRILTPN
jgi:VWFA-related protein